MLKREFDTQDSSQLRQIWIEIEVQRLMRCSPCVGGDDVYTAKAALVETLTGCWQSVADGTPATDTDPPGGSLPAELASWGHELRWRLRCGRVWKTDAVDGETAV